MLRIVALALLLPALAVAQEATLIANTNPTGGDLIGGGGSGDAVSDAVDLPTGPYFVEYRGELYFRASDGVNGAELWRSNGTPEGTSLVADLAPGAASSFPRNFVVYAGRLYFGARVGDVDRTFVTDGETVAELASGLSPIRAVFDGLLLSPPGTSEPYSILGNCRPDGTGGPLCGFGPLSGSSVIPRGLTQTSRWLIYRDDDGSLWRGTGVPSFEVKLAPSQIPQTVNVVGAPMGLGGTAYFACNWEPNPDDTTGRELCANDGGMDEIYLVSDLLPGTTSDGFPLSSDPALIGVHGGALYVGARTADSGSQYVLHRVLPGGTIERVDATAGTAPNLNSQGVGLDFAVAREGAFFRGEFGSGVGAPPRIFLGSTPVFDVGGASVLLDPFSDGARAFVFGRSDVQAPFTLYQLSASGGTAVATAPDGAFPSAPTVYNGGVVFTSQQEGLYGFDVRPRAVRRDLADGLARGTSLAFDVFDSETPLPATFEPDAAASGEIRVSLTDSSRTPLPGAPPALFTLATGYQLGTTAPEARGTLTLSYTDAALFDAGTSDEAGLSVWQWDTDAQAWAERTVTARDAAANTLTVEGVAPESFFVLGSNVAVAVDAPATEPLALDGPWPNPTASTATIRVDVDEPGPLAVR
ncbi:MAG: ELWxxDGT repeat protein, partial [Bacteroidota bacterium]